MHGAIPGLVTALAVSFILTACTAMRPTLLATVPDGARDVPLTAELKIQAHGAVLQRAILERIDPPGPPIELRVSEAEAWLAGGLDPSARYRLVATAHARELTPLPWQSRGQTTLSLERVFSTVRAPILLTAESQLVARPGRPLELQFSEPLARAAVRVPGHTAEAEISRGDPRVLRVYLTDPAPGEQLDLRLVDVVGENGAPSEEYRLRIRTPDAVTLTTVNGGPVSNRVTAPADRPLTLEWSRPVSEIRYAVEDAPSVWSGEPQRTVRLPVRAVSGRSLKVAITEATAEDGGWLPSVQVFELAAPSPLRVAATWPENGATNVSVTGDPTIRFSEPIALEDQATAEAAILFDPPVSGRFQWLTRDRVRFLPETSFPRLTDVTLTILGGPDGVRGESGSLMEDDFTLVFQTGRKKVIDVSLGRQVLTLLEDDEPVWSAPVATGVRGAETPPGTYQVQAKIPVARFRGVNPDGSRYDIPNVRWVLAFYGDYTIHGAYWRRVFGRPGSAGCVSLTDANAKVVYDWADEGTPVIIRR